MCGKKRGRSKGDTRWWNEEVKEAVSRKYEVHKYTILTACDEVCVERRGGGKEKEIHGGGMKR